MPAIASQLRENISGEVRFDATSRALYSTDASIYQIEPLGVVLPKTRQDILTTLQICAEHAVALIPRGGGTSQTGACLGRGVILDCSKYMKGVRELNLVEGWAWVEPGVVPDELNAELQPHGMTFPVDISPANRANFGGMCGTNAGGSRSLVYGKMIDNVLSLEAALADGQVIAGRALTSEELSARLAQPDMEGATYRAIDGLARQHHNEIETRFPKIQRRVGGYNLDEFIKPQPFNLAKMLVGSEGTLAVTLAAQVKLAPRPKRTGLAIVHFRSVQAALEATPRILEYGPSQVELMDKVLLDMTRQQIQFARRMHFVEGDPGALLSVEFFGESDAEVKSKLEGLQQGLQRAQCGYAIVLAYNPAMQADILTVRKAGVGLLLGIRTDRKPIAFIEDTAVPPQHLARYIQRLDEIVQSHGTSAAYYAHASVGLLHIRPMIDLKSTDDVGRMRSIAVAISDLVLEYGGAISGEHGDGLLRSEFNEKIFGPTLYAAFREIKRTFDPQGRLNPGKITDAQSMVENLRYGARDGQPYKTMPVKTYFSFEREGGFGRAIEMCNGNGECRKRLSGTMCPSYMVTLEEQHSTRGRANLLREAINGHLPADALTGSELYEALDLCLECKGCKADCPSSVDMAKLKYEFLAHYHARHGTPLRAHLFGQIALLNRVGSALAPISNWVAGSRPARLALDRLVGIDARRRLPAFTRQTFAAWFRRHPPPQDAASRPQVALFNDTFTNYNYPHIGQAATRVLEALGYSVILAERKCCGRPMISKGLIQQAKANARWNVAALAKYSEAGIPVVGLEPSCLLTLRDDYLDLVDDPRAAVVAQNALLFEEFVARELERDGTKLKLSPATKPILFHGHCHQKALVGSAPSLRVLKAIPAAQVTEVDSGCCGMAGSFGFEKEHYDLSLAIGARRLFPAVQQAPQSEIVAAGTSCRQQILHGTGRRARHIAEVLAEALIAQ
ncbi:MAG: anaerobic glycerol-3-phosphate dehydrogenase subunit C [Chloroflexi bacterium]|nr:anaerobic glycerol-3-phosphate dehydrogenase subunit C [Chloroflexota bacterium]